MRAKGAVQARRSSGSVQHRGGSQRRRGEATGGACIMQVACTRALGAYMRMISAETLHNSSLAAWRLLRAPCTVCACCHAYAHRGKQIICDRCDQSVAWRWLLPQGPLAHQSSNPHFAWQQSTSHGSIPLPWNCAPCTLAAVVKIAW